jgi:hypothetical protein
MSTHPGFVIRVASRAEVDIAVDWAAAEGWNPGLHDADCFHAADPSGFLLGLLDGDPVATISVVKYADAFGFLGFYIVKPGFRGRGLGLAIWQAGMASLAGRTVGLDGVVAQQDNYRKSGFELAWQNVRQQGIAGGPAPHDERIKPLSSLPFAMVEAYDRRFFPAERTAFLRCWLRQPASTALGSVERGQLKGYGMVRPCREGFKVGPLFADSPEIAQGLFAALRSAAPQGERIFLDTPAPNGHALDLAQQHGMTPVFETARMYAGTAPQVALEHVYGITSFELG